MTRPLPFPTPTPGALGGAAVGDSGSAAALKRLDSHLQAVRTRSLQPLLKKALASLRAGRRDQAASLAQEALGIDAGSGLAWHILAICQEKGGDYTSALQSYEQAFARMPGEPEIANDLGRLALKMGMAEIAEALFGAYLQQRPDSVEGLNNLACAQRDQMKFDEAVETLKAGLQAHPDRALLWNALASVLTLQGQMEQATVFYDEALRLDPGFVFARYNRAGARLAMEDFDGALEDLDACIGAAGGGPEGASMRLMRAKTLLAAGRLAEGWEAYQARLDPLYEDVTLFLCDRPEWTPDMDLAGKRLLLIGEQGVGDEILFAGAVPKVLQALGPDGELALAVEPRLASLFARAFPQATVGPHASHRVDHRQVRAAPFLEDRAEAFDAWAPLGAPLRRWGADVAAFGGEPYLAADPDRVAHWRRVLAERPGVKAGVLWKSLVMDAERSRHFAPFADWEPVFAVPGVTFVNLQYGEVEEEAAALAEGMGVALWRLPGFDPKDSLEDVAAVACALDVSIGPATVTTNLAGACGAKMWMISFPGAWPRLGTPAYPWYRTMRVFTPEAYGRWRPLMERIGANLAALAG